jgi:hypothetical protein
VKKAVEDAVVVSLGARRRLSELDISSSHGRFLVSIRVYQEVARTLLYAIRIVPGRQSNARMKLLESQSKVVPLEVLSYWLYNVVS